MTVTPAPTWKTFGEGESMIHDLVNAGTEDIVFTTVESLDSANDPLPLPVGVRP